VPSVYFFMRALSLSLSLPLIFVQMPVSCFLIRYRAVHLLRFFGGKAAASSSVLKNIFHVVVKRLGGDTTHITMEATLSLEK
jgi:hypothetical protein